MYGNRQEHHSQIRKDIRVPSFNLRKTGDRESALQTISSSGGTDPALSCNVTVVMRGTWNHRSVAPRYPKPGLQQQKRQRRYTEYLFHVPTLLSDHVEGRHLNPPGHPRHSFVTTFLRYFIGRAHQKNIRNDGIPPVPNRESTRQDARPEMPRICYGGIPRHLHPRREDSNRPRLRLR